MSTVMEVAIRKVKANQDAEFAAARTNFIGKLKQQSGIEHDWEFKSFFTMPGSDDTDVFVGMTRYESPEAAGKIAEVMMPSEEAQAFFATFDMKAFGLSTPADGEPFVLEDIINQPGQVLEVAFRKPSVSEEEFQAKRKGFFDLVAAQSGYIMDREFVTLEGDIRVVLIAWESQEHFMAALGALQTAPEMGEFFGVIEVQAYQALQLVAG